LFRHTHSHTSPETVFNLCNLNTRKKRERDRETRDREDLPRRRAKRTSFFARAKLISARTLKTTDFSLSLSALQFDFLSLFRVGF